jgi:hypothetical protein
MNEWRKPIATEASLWLRAEGEVYSAAQQLVLPATALFMDRLHNEIRMAVARHAPEYARKIASEGYAILMRATGRPYAQLRRAGYMSLFDDKMNLWAKNILDGTRRVYALHALMGEWMTDPDSLPHHFSNAIGQNGDQKNQSTLHAKLLLQDWQETAFRSSTYVTLMQQTIQNYLGDGDEDDFVRRLTEPYPFFTTLQ